MSYRSKIKTRAKQRGKKSIRFHRSNQHIYLQLADETGCVVAGVSTLTPSFRQSVEGVVRVNQATAAKLATHAVDVFRTHLDQPCAFDRGGFLYKKQGVVASVASVLRDAKCIL